MMVYLLKSIACLLILLLVHRLLLQREAMHRFNRFFLLFSVIASFLIPLYTIEVPVIEEATAIVEEPSEVIEEEYSAEPISSTYMEDTPVFTTIEEVQPEFNWEYLLFGVYSLISMVFLFRFIRNIKILVNQIQRNVKVNYRGQTLVLLQEDSLPFSFLKYIFVSEADLENGKFTDAVFDHERTHIEEKHTWDILFVEGLLVLFWFHPGLYWAKATVKLNHEFIADAVALRSTSLEKYESQLLAMMLSGHKYGLVSSLNFSLTKKRFEMMKRRSMNSKSWVKILVLVPILGGMVYFFSERVAAKAETEMSVVYVNASNQSSDEEMDFDLTFTLMQSGVIQYQNENYDLEAVKELISESKKFQDAVKINLITSSGISMGELSDFHAILRDLDIRRIYYAQSGNDGSVEKFEELSSGQFIQKGQQVSLNLKQGQVDGSKVAQEEQKAQLYSEVKFLVEDVQMHYIFKNYSELTDKERSMLLSPPLPPPGIKEDGTVSPSFENERENDVSKIPHIFFTPDGDPSLTYSLFTESYVEEVTSLKNGKGSITITPAAIYLVDISNYANPADYFFQKFAEYESLRSGKPHYVNKSRKDQAIMEALYFELSALSYQFSEEIRSELGLLFSNQYSPLKTPILPYVKLVKDGEIQYKKRDELNEVERQLLPAPHPPLPSVWETTKPSKYIAADKQSSEPVADQKKDTSVKWPPKVKADRQRDQLQSYIDANLAYEKLRSQAPHFVEKSKAEQDKLTAIFSDLGSMYYQVSFYDKAKIDRPVHPFAPYLQLESNGEVYYKLKGDLTAEELSQLSPPPPPADGKKEVEAYYKLYLQYELRRQEGRNNSHRSSADREEMYQMYNELQDKFLAMEPVQRRQVKMVNFPYIPLEENGQLVFKAVDELSPEQRALTGC